jgi:hypothetical protein
MMDPMEFAEPKMISAIGSNKRMLRFFIVD